jgi:hypothetical protein
LAKRKKLQKTDELYAKAAAAFDTGDYKAAKKWANECLKVDKKEFRSLNLLGVLLANEGKLEAAANAYQKSLEANPRNPQTLNNLANTYAKNSDVENALKYYKKAIEVDGSFIIARYNMAKALVELKRYEEAADEALKCLEQDAGFLKAYLTVGICLKEQNRFEEAKEAYKRALQDPDSVVDALINLGTLAKDEKNFAESEIYLRKAVEIDPNSALGFNNLGVTLQAAKKYGEALEAFFRAIAILPSETSFSNLATLLMEIGEYQKAKGAILKALEINPKSVQAYVNYGVLLKWTGEYEESAKAFIHAIELDATNMPAKVNLGILLMLFGDYRQGLALYEAREKPTIICDRPLWNKELLDGKTILIYHEQGFGDTINFARLLTNEAFKGAKIIFSPQDALQSLFKNSTLPCVTMNHNEIETQNPHFDYHTTLISLLQLLDINKDNIPSTVPYIKDDGKKVEYFKDKLPKDKLKIGIVWQGNKQYVGDAKRSVSASSFAIFKDDRISFVSLQKEFEKEDLAQLKESLAILDFSSDIVDFSDTSALIECLDMVITVDTSVAHLAATKNKPTWILLPLSPDWRWGLWGESTPWYGSARLFRQTPEGWDELFRRVKNELQKILQ